ncbi:MAG: tyrosine-type recombinase/integrase [Pseudomonadota bacterium]
MALNARDETISLFDEAGRRKYLNAGERCRFLAASREVAPPVRRLCEHLHYTGCRPSEAVNMCWRHLDVEQASCVIETLKQRRRGIYRSVPLPRLYVDGLQSIAPTSADGDAPVWCWHRATVWRKVTEVMQFAGISGAQACPRGIRHGFGVAAVATGVPLTLVQRWLGHTRLETTAIYLQVIGPEERKFAERMWRI